MMTVVD